MLLAVREAVGDGVAVGLRTSAGHMLPGYGPEEALAAVAACCEGGLADWVSVMGGSYWAFDVQIPPLATPRPAFTAEGRAFRDALGIPIVLTGRIRTPAEAEDLLSAGAADVVGLVRALIADPEWVAKARREEADRIRPCVSCNQGCLSFAFRGYPGAASSTRRRDASSSCPPSCPLRHRGAWP